jgi:hypothetical protein
VRDEGLTHYFNQGMVEIFPYLVFDEGIHARKRRWHDDSSPVIENQKTHMHSTRPYQKWAPETRSVPYAQRGGPWCLTLVRPKRTVRPASLASVTLRRGRGEAPQNSR